MIQFQDSGFSICGRKLAGICVLLVLVLILFLHVDSGLAETYSVQNGNSNATLEKIEVINDDILVITWIFQNKSNDAASFNWTFTTNVYQNNVECSDLYFNSNNKNLGTDIRGGATIEVCDAYILRNNHDIVEVETGTWAFMNHKIKVYFNPENGKWGSRDEIKTTPEPKSTPNPTETPKPTEIITSSHEDVSDSLKWICPNCGRKLDSRFCPDCGVPSPTPAPTPTPTPAPTDVPMNINHGVENVVNYDYTVSYAALKQAGKFTGETIDGFPHGYGLFDSDEWFYIGNWSFGLPEGEGSLYIKELQTSQSFDSFKEEYTDESTISALMPGKIKKGGIVTFGHYEQDNDLSNGLETIEWIVLDVQDDKCLLMSKYGLDAKQYNDTNGNSWEKSILRNWLNSDFFNTAFKKTERSDILIALTDEKCEDRVFLLNSHEVSDLNLKDSDLNKCILTDYAIAQGAMEYKEMDADGNLKSAGMWWLRPEGNNEVSGFYVSHNGKIYNNDVMNSYVCVRPVLWVNIK